MRSVQLQALLLIAAIFALYRPALEYDFVWDDNLYVVSNPAVHSWIHAPAAFTSPHTTWSSNSRYTIPAWRPLRNISYLIDHTLYGLNPIGWHLTNIILHATAAVLLLLLLRRLVTLLPGSADVPPAQTPAHQPAQIATPPSHTDLACLLAAAAWALHPVQTEVVAWVKSRDDLLATPLMFAALLLALPRTLPTGKEPLTQSRRDPGGWKLSAVILRLVLPAILFTAALLSKENTIILAGLYPIILFLLSPRLSVSALRNLLTFSRFSPSHLLTILIFPVIALAYLLIHHQILGRTAQAAHPGDTPAQTILTMLHALARYAQLTLWPWPPTTQSADYDNYPIITTPLNPATLTGLAILLVMLFLLLHFLVTSCLRVKNLGLTIPPVAAIGLTTILISLLPFANIIPMMQVLAERFLYLPLAGVAILLTALVIRVSCFCSSSRLCAFAFKFLPVFFIAALAIQTHRRLPVWTNELTLFRDTHHVNPTSWRPADQYTRALLRSSQTTAALTIADQNLQQFPGDPDIIRTAALAHLLAGHETTATLLTNYAIQLQPNDPRASDTLQQWQHIQNQTLHPTAPNR